MDMQTILADWNQNAKRHDDRNFSFLRSLKERSERAVDRAARRLHQEAFSIIDCTRCANCCKTVSPTFASDDIERIAKHLGMETGGFVLTYLSHAEDEAGFKPNSMPCPFLGDDDRCTIYEVRPASCAQYPHTDKPGFASRTYVHSENALHCPAVFYIVEQMRARGVKPRQEGT